MRKVLEKRCRETLTTFVMDNDGDLVKKTTVWTWTEYRGNMVGNKRKSVYYELPTPHAPLDLNPVKPLKI